MKAYAEDYHIKPGDTIGITVLDEKDLTKHAVVDPKGNISMPLINEIHVADLTLSQAAKDITSQLQKFIKNPQVSIELIDSSKMQVTISGEVKSPGVYSVPSGAQLMDVITMAGGYSQTADLSKVAINHKGNTSTTIDLSKFLLAGDAGQNVQMSAGDTIFIPTRETEVIGIVTVLGAVRQAGQHQIVKGMTVREAIMLAGGPTELADINKVTLRHAGTSEALRIDYVAASSGLLTANPELKPGDVIYVAAREVLGHYTIYGAVATPGRYELKDKTTLTEAIAMAGGAREKARLDNVKILRTTNGTNQTIVANVTAIMGGKAENIIVQDQDSIYVNQPKEGIDWFKMLSVGASLAWLLLRH